MQEVRDMGSIPGLGRPPGGGLGNSLQYSCLENPMDRGAWWATVHRVTKSSDGKSLPALQETQVPYMGWITPWKRKWQPTPVFLPGDFHGQRSLVGYSPWGHKVLEMTGWWALYWYNKRRDWFLRNSMEYSIGIKIRYFWISHHNNNCKHLYINNIAKCQVCSKNVTYNSLPQNNFMIQAKLFSLF